ncbi:MAG: hypothetical protein ACXW2P_00330 [Thermoanaerobaculia bacterium]
MHEPETWWRRATVALVIIWLVALSRWMVADVWDETNALVAFGSSTWSTSEAVRFVLMESMGIWRPLPSALAVLIIRGIGDPGIAWRVMRLVNVGLLLSSLVLFVLAMNRWEGVSWRRTALFTLTFLYSAGALIVAGWFANLFDAWVLFLAGLGVFLLSRRWFVAAGVLFGVAFFCKETAALSLPMLVLFMTVGYLGFRDVVKAGVPAVVLGGLYFFLRNRVIPFGSSADTHQFLPADFVPTIVGLMESYWRQTLWGSGPGILGFCFFAFSLAVMPGWRARGAFLLLVLATAMIYWQMFAPYQHEVLIHYLMFVGRLYLIPAVITLFVLAGKREWSLIVLAVPLLAGGVATYVRYERFQESYRNVYRHAAGTQPPTRIFFPMKPLNDPDRGLEIGDLPNAPLVLDPATGRLVPRTPTP